MTKDDYIRLISKASNKHEDKLLDMLNYYKKFGLRELTKEEVKTYYEKYVEEQITEIDEYIEWLEEEN